MSQRQEAEAAIRQRFDLLHESLNERARRLFAASEAIAFGWGGVAAVSRATGLARDLVRRGIAEVNASALGQAEPLAKGRVRRPGGGRKKAADKNPALVPDLTNLFQSTTPGAPEPPLLWTTRSQRDLVRALAEKGHKISINTLAGLLKDLGYRLQRNKTSHEGAQHPDRNAQFEHINEMVLRQHAAAEPVLSLDIKKREKTGSLKNAAKELAPRQAPELVEASLDLDLDPKPGNVAPDGGFDLTNGDGWVSVDINHDTAEFSVEAIRTWYQEMGREAYPNATSLLITADSRGSNRNQRRLWSRELQKLANELALEIKVCHLPPGMSKWSRIGLRRHTFITQNWRGTPLITHQVVLDLISPTKTATGLKAQRRLDHRTYEKGRKVPDTERGELHLVPEDWHGEWNYSIKPVSSSHH